MIDYSTLASHGMTDDEMRALRARLEGRAYVKKGRYGNVAKRTEYKGTFYDSRAEADYAACLDAQVMAGNVAWWLRQVTVPLGPDFKTKVDFLVGRALRFGEPHIEAHEVKGPESREFAKVRRLWGKYAPFNLRIIKRGQEPEVIEGKTTYPTE